MEFLSKVKSSILSNIIINNTSNDIYIQNKIIHLKRNKAKYFQVRKYNISNILLF